MVDLPFNLRVEIERSVVGFVDHGVAERNLSPVVMVILATTDRQEETENEN